MARVYKRDNQGQFAATSGSPAPPGQPNGHRQFSDSIKASRKSLFGSTGSAKKTQSPESMLRSMYGKDKKGLKAALEGLHSTDYLTTDNKGRTVKRTRFKNTKAGNAAKRKRK